MIHPSSYGIFALTMQLHWSPDNSTPLASGAKEPAHNVIRAGTGWFSSYRLTAAVWRLSRSAIKYRVEWLQISHRHPRWA